MGVSYIIPDIFPNGKRVFVFAACRQRGAFGWTRGPGTRGGSGRDLPAGPFSTPRFFAAQRSAGSSRREEIAILRWRVNTQGSAVPCAIPVVLIKQRLPCRALLRFLSALSFWSAIAFQVAGFSTTRLPSSELTVFRRRKAFLLCKNPCGGTAVGMGSPTQRTQLPRKEISRGNLLCAASGLPSLSYPRPESAQKYVTTPDWKNFCTGQPQGARGTAVPFVSGRVQRNPFQGVPLGNFFAEARHRASFRR